MAHEHTVSFKVFLQKAGINEKPEVRRFGIDRDVVSNFSYFKQKLQAVFPALQGNDFTVSWKDNEGDDVIISSDDELIIALTEMTTEVRKLYVTNASPKQDRPTGRSVHIGITCDGCNKAVEGFRYKCVQCRDYDLCANCEAKGLHSEHYMIRLPVPVSWRPHFGRRLAHHLSKSASRKSSCSPPEGPEAGQCPWGGRGWSKHHHPHMGRHGGWLETLVGYLNEWANLPGEGPGECERETQGASGDKSGACKQEDSHVQYLLNVGQTVANMLDPLGIDVDVEIQTNKGENKKVPKPADEQSVPNEKPKTQNVTFADKTETQETASGTEKSDKEQTNADAKTEKTSKSSSVPSKTDRESPETEGWTVLNGDVQPPQESGPDESSDTMTLDVFNLKVARAEAAAAAAAAYAAARDANAAYAVRTDSAAVADSAAVNAATNSVNGYTGAMPKQPYPVFYPPPSTTAYLPWAVPPPPPTTRVYPNLPFTAAPSAPHSQTGNQKAHITDAVQKMMSMGFSNEGGWLTQLLEIKNGDIEKALDVLQPVKK